MSRDNTNQANAIAANSLPRRDPSTIRKAGQAKEILKGLPELIQIVIDGPNSFTKRPLGEMMAQELGALLIDGDKFDRCFAKSCLKAGVALDDVKGVEEYCRNAKLGLSFRQAEEGYKEALPVVNDAPFIDEGLESIRSDKLTTPYNATHRNQTKDIAIELARSFRIVLLGRGASETTFPATPFKFSIDAPCGPEFKEANPNLSEPYLYFSRDIRIKKEVLFIPINTKTREEAFNRMLVEIARQYLRQQTSS